MNKNDVMVSICCLTYNHEKYVRQALDGFLMQKTSFKYEILIHDDCSTDETADIIREYEKKYPDIIKPIYQTENQHSKGVKISWVHQFPRGVGKYFAICEGDDYWTDEYKLQKQFDLMESHSECSICCHKVGCINDKDERTSECYPNKLIAPFMKQDLFVKEIVNSYQFQTSSYFLHSEVLKQYVENIPQFIYTLRVGDVGWLLLCAKDGDLCFIDEEMSVYRRNVSGSWSERQKSENRKEKQSQNFINGLKEYDAFTENKYHGFIEYAIKKCIFSNLYNQKKYKELLSLENREFYKLLPFKSKLIIRIFSVFPFLRGWLKK